MDNKILFLIFLLFVIALLASFKNPTEYRCTDCNVILISIDSLRYDHLGINGYQKNTSPNIDNFARDSIFFPNYITQAYLTPISEASIHTSRYPSSNGFVSFTSMLDSQATKLEDVLRIYGYNNYAFVGSGNFYGDGTFVDQFSPSYKVYRFTSEKRGFPLNPNELKNFTKEKFFLWISIGNIHWPYGVPNAPQKYVDMFVDKNYSGPLKDIILDENFLPYIRDSIAHRRLNGTEFLSGYSLTNDDKKYIIDNYDSGIRYVDNYIGDLIQSIKENGLMNNTIIVIQSEHGEELGDHGRFTHGDIFENTIHTLLTIHNPVLKQKGTVLTQAQGLDIMPTILDMIGIPIPESVQGKSLTSVILDKTDVIHGKVNSDFNKYVFSERIPNPSQLHWILNITTENAIPIKTIYEILLKYNETDARNVLQDLKDISNDSYDEDLAVRTNEWKLIERPAYRIHILAQYKADSHSVDPDALTVNYSSLYQLYDLKNDPNEQKNLAGKKLPIENELIKVLREWRKMKESLKIQYVFNKTVFPNYTFT